MTVQYFKVDPPPAGSSYATPVELREALDVDDTVLPDAEAEDLLEDVAVLIDGLLGARPIDPTTGRKVVEARVHPWQWKRVVRATIQLAARIYRDPTILGGTQQFQTVKGPDFETTGPLKTGSALYGDDVRQLIAGSQLGVWTGRMR